MRRLIEHCSAILPNGTTCGKEIRILSESPELASQVESFEDFIGLMGEDSEEPFPDSILTGNTIAHLKCGHELISSSEEILQRFQRNALWDKLLPFQQRAVEDVERSGINCYLNYEMGTGKTPIASSVLRENLDEMLPCLVISESGDIYRWKRELVKWLGLGEMIKSKSNGSGQLSIDNLEEIMSLTPQILNKSTTSARVAKITITSWTNIHDPKFLAMLAKLGYKSVIADEAHMFKNEDASRSQGFIKLCSFIPHRIFLSGTWIENALAEAFVPLNVLDPRYFNSRSALESHCITSSSGKALSLSPHRRDYFFRRISKYVFRLTKADAGISLPLLRSYSNELHEPTWIDPTKFKSNLEFINDYNKTLDDLEEELASKRPSYGTVIGFMSQLRHHTGKMKVMAAAEWVGMKMMELEAGQKLCIGVHHKSVMAWLKELLEKLGFPVLCMSDEAPEIKDKIEDQFRKPENRIMIVSILGAGKGRNLQFCQNALVLERQWNKSKEMQFEQRFHRISVDLNDNIRTYFTEADDVVIDYLMAKSSFDEYFDYLVRLKGEIVDSADMSVEDSPAEGLVWELARLVVSTRIKYVGM